MWFSAKTLQETPNSAIKFGRMVNYKNVSSNIVKRKVRFVGPLPACTDPLRSDAVTMIALQLEMCVIEPPRRALEFEALMCNDFKWETLENSSTAVNKSDHKKKEIIEYYPLIPNYDVIDFYFSLANDAEEFNCLKAYRFDLTKEIAEDILAKVRDGVNINMKSKISRKSFTELESTSIIHESNGTRNMSLKCAYQKKLLKLQRICTKLFSNLYLTPKKSTSKRHTVVTSRFFDDNHLFYDLGFEGSDSLYQGKNYSTSSKIRKIMNFY